MAKLEPRLEKIMDSAQDVDLPAPLGGTRAEAMQRLQIGLFGLAAMLLMMALASVVMNRAKESEATAVPEAAATVAPKPQPAPTSDPLVDVGVVPDLPSGKAQPGVRPSGKATPSASQAVPAAPDAPPRR